jgi:short-subunit dehydrogenase
MQLEGKRIVLTGAAGGMGALIAGELAAQGARLVLVDLNEDRLESLTSRLGAEHKAVAVDLCDPAGRNQLVEACKELQGIDILINAAGISQFALLDAQTAERIQFMTMINLVVPMQLCQALLPLLRARPEAAIVNIGSTFGSIGHAGFSTYCATKFGLRGFTESLRRELSDTKVGVFYIAPRATQTDMNSEAVVELNRELGNAMDQPEVVVDEVIRLLKSRREGDYFLGWPEKLFVRVNGLLPRVVDKSLGKQLATIKRLASQA